MAMHVAFSSNSYRKVDIAKNTGANPDYISARRDLESLFEKSDDGDEEMCQDEEEMKNLT